MLKKPLLILTLALIIFLVALSVWSAFIGAERTSGVMNSVPMTALWLFFAFLTASGFFSFRNLRKRLPLLLMHLGFIFVVVGSMLTSEESNKLLKKFGIDKIHKGTAVIYEGQTAGEVSIEDGTETAKLPFGIKLRDFRIEYYEPYISADIRRFHTIKMPGRPGLKALLPYTEITVKVLRTFDNFKINIRDGKNEAYDSAEPGFNPAAEIEVTDQWGRAEKRFVFPPELGRGRDRQGVLFAYHKPVKEYISDVDIVENENIITSDSIEVNKPMHFAGYHIYQNSYDPRAGEYTVLRIVSDTGIYVVYIGFILIVWAVFHHFWYEKLYKTYSKTRKTPEPANRESKDL